MNSSLAGTWGEQKRMELSRKGLIDSINKNDLMRTTYSETFGGDSIALEKSRSSGKLAKFRTLQQSGKSILDYPKISSNDAEEDGINEMGMSSSCNFERTSSSMLRLEDSRVALGRSGLRVERGLTTSGLLGERLLDEKGNPQKMTAVQRSWLYQDDPALMYRLNGIPKAEMPNDVSLIIGEMKNEDGKPVPAEPVMGTSKFGRKYAITGDQLCRSMSTQETRVFIDADE